MNLINTLIDFLKQSPEQKKDETPIGFCPNCWGQQEYGEKFYKASKNYNVDINSNNPNVGWIQEYANKNLSGIVLQPKNDKIVCQNCKITYSPEK